MIKEKWSQKKKDFQIDTLVHDYTVFNGRVNMFLLSESMLIITYVTSLNLEPFFKTTSILINLLGITITSLYIIVLGRNTDNIQNQKKELMKYHILFKEFYEKRIAVTHRVRSSNIFLGKFLPIAFFFFWFILLFIVVLYIL